jgi:hypothetical protein
MKDKDKRSRILVIFHPSSLIGHFIFLGDLCGLCGSVFSLSNNFSKNEMMRTGPTFERRATTATNMALEAQLTRPTYTAVIMSVVCARLHVPISHVANV